MCSVGNRMSGRLNTTVYYLTPLFHKILKINQDEEEVKKKKNLVNFLINAEQKQHQTFAYIS